MEFYERYIAWRTAVGEAVDALRLMAIEADWKHIISKEQEIEEWLMIIQRYNLWQEFEGFALTTEQNKVDGFFKNFESQLDYWLYAWEGTYDHEDHEEFKDWFYKMAFHKLNKKPDEANRVAKLITRTGDSLKGIENLFEQVKNTYTSLPPRSKKLFYERVKDRFLKNDIDNPILKYTCIDWLNGDMDEVLVRFYLIGGEDINPLVWPEKWQQFNQWLEAECKRPKELFTEVDLLGEKKSILMDSYTITELIDLFVNRVVHHEGNKHLLFRHQVEFYPFDERKKIWSEMAKIHTQIVADNWYHWQKCIDIAVQGSVDAPKFIADTINLIEHYFDGQAVDLIYPLYKPYNVSQQAVIDAYQSLLRGYREVEYIRPPQKLKPIEGFITEEDIMNYIPQHLTSSPFVEAELLVKARDYLKQQLAEPKPTKSIKISLENTLLCTLIKPQITSLFNRLSAGRYIDSGVTLAEFSDALLGFELMAKPLQWSKSNRALAYLFKQMYGSEMINNREWQSVIQKRALYHNRKGKLITAQDLAQAITDYQRDGNPTEASNIDTILEEVKNRKD